MRIIIACTLSLLVLFTSAAMAEDINGRLGLTGKAGVIVPLEDSTINGQTFWLSDEGFAGGGGIMYGIGQHLAVETDITHVPSLDVKMGTGGKVAEAQFTDFSIGLQFRIPTGTGLVPYVGGGADFIKGDISSSTLDWAVGGHVNGGVDYFVNKSIALNLEARGIFAEKSDIQQNGQTVGKFNPDSVVTTFGVRLFLPKYW